MASVGWPVAQEVAKWACPGIVGLPWRGGRPQVEPRRGHAPKMGLNMGRAKRYAQCSLVDMSALMRNMFGHVCSNVGNLVELTPSCANIKLLKSIGNLW